MNPQANPYPQQPPQGWPQNNLTQQMGNMNISGPPKPGMPPMSMPQQFPPQNQQYSGINNNQQVPPPISSASTNFVSPTNNNPTFNGMNGTSQMTGAPPSMAMPPQMANRPMPQMPSQGFPTQPVSQPQQQQRPPIQGENFPPQQQNGMKNGSADFPPPPANLQQPPSHNQFPTPPAAKPVEQPGMPPMPSQQRPPMSSTPNSPPTGIPPPTQSQLPPMSQNPIQQQASGMPPMPGQTNQPQMMAKSPMSMPPMPNQNQTPISQPQMTNQAPGMQSMTPQQQQPNQFPGMPPMPQQAQPQFAKMPLMNGQQQQQQQMSGMPPMLGQQRAAMPPMPGQQPMMGGMSPMPGQQQQMGGMPPMPGQQPQMGGMPPMPGQQSTMGGMPSMPGQQPQMGGMPPMPGQQPQMGGMPPMPGQQPQMGGMPPMPGQQPQMGGMPPMPGQQQQQQFQGMTQQNRQNINQPSHNYNHPGQQFQQYQQSPMQQQPARRLDPDQMPNPIQVMSENQKSAGGVFSTLTIGQVPPLVTTNFVTQDQGNSGPRYVRSTMYNIPATTEMMKQSAVPFALVISPFAKPVGDEMQIPIVDFGEVGPIRCVRCKAYMSPYMQFIDAGRRFQCLLCKATTEVPAAYFQHLDHTGQRADKYERPELVLGTYEFLATKDYCRNNMTPNPPAMIFVIDVSYNNIKSGLVHLLCSQIKDIIRNLPIDQGHSKTKMKVGFITYNKTVHFYNIKSTLAQPQMLVVGDVHEMFMPLLDGFLADPEESETVIDLLMEQIPKMFGDTRETETILLPAIQAGLEALKASDCVGKLLVFHSTLPVSEAPGQLKNRDDRKLLGTEKEKQVLTPQSTAYNNLGQDCVNAGCSVDLFIFNNSYIDLATIGQVSRLTGGEIYKYTYFQADIDGHRLINDLIKHVARPIAFDAVMRVRTSTGTRPTDFYGHFFMSNTTDMEIAAIDCDKSVAIEIKHDDKLPPEENVYVQIALLYTSTSGQRRLRVLNLAFRTCTQLADLFRSCDLDTTILFFAKQGVTKLLEHTPKVFRDNLVTRAAQILACYRKNCASPTSAGQLILPECLKLLPLYVSCLLKNDAFSGGSDMTVDDRSYAMYFVATMDLPTSVGYFYPRLVPIHTVDVDGDDIPAPIRCTAEKITDDGAYILDNGIYLFVYLGFGLSPEFTQQVFGAQGTHMIDTERIGLPILDNPLSIRVRGIIDRIQNERTRCMRVALIRQRDKLETVFRHFLIEDRGSNGAESYVDFLCYMHKEIRSLLS